jgi:hypothetical protein
MHRSTARNSIANAAGESAAKNPKLVLADLLKIRDLYGKNAL